MIFTARIQVFGRLSLLMIEQQYSYKAKQDRGCRSMVRQQLQKAPERFMVCCIWLPVCMYLTETEISLCIQIQIQVTAEIDIAVVIDELEELLSST